MRRRGCSSGLIAARGGIDVDEREGAAGCLIRTITGGGLRWIGGYGDGDLAGIPGWCGHDGCDVLRLEVREQSLTDRV